MNELADDAVLSLSFSEISYEYIVAALCGKTVGIKACIGVRRFGSLITQGVYINTLTEASDAVSAIPKLSPLVLRCYARGNINALSTAEKFLAHCLLEMFIILKLFGVFVWCTCK
jgi:hypothetical protein